METITMFLPLLMLLFMGLIAFVIIKVVGIKPDPSLRDASRLESILLTLLGFFFPLIGLILFLVWRKSRPELATPIATGIKVYFGIILIGVVISIIAAILYGTVFDVTNG